MKKLTQEERLARLADRAEDARINALFAQGSLNRPALAPEAPAEPEAYTVTTLPSAFKRKAAAEKAARTRRLNRQAQG
jgi:hypothetical protein